MEREACVDDEEAEQEVVELEEDDADRSDDLLTCGTQFSSSDM